MFNKSQDNGNCGKRNDREGGPGVPKNKVFLVYKHCFESFNINTILLQCSCELHRF